MEKVAKFLKEVNAELHKVTWPTKDELIGSTIVVIVVSIIVAVFIGVVDRVLTVLVQAIFGGGA
ncbi:MAG TPA: preprotein translocase subunit SecE [candidate division Zixibacteria bacterium]|nr:preprotein translocase subunit SecE [candidate division Zixibacteria bacterium]MDD4918413.1 preprotein translocase subunit SecE [candidate division Zixibacteria bacterium]MDM7973245.1 preprotein translocase subunit SecE [candidate division Zixibacteria bacterium]HOD67384.1 preprotein translocase subunit SecE [candidate division Zixibacteria bacterium]HPI31899.1 preprotein translocase subunit SecE [candidate division Zixibacteria bacterium]